MEKSTGKNTRCQAEGCKKKVFACIECRCGKKFCMKHRLPEKHMCNFDYKILRKNTNNFKSKMVMVHSRQEGSAY